LRKINGLLKQDDLIKDVQRALEEDIGSGDVTAALLPADLMVEADIISREPMFVCGQPWVDATFGAVDAGIKVEWFVTEGTWLDKPSRLCTLQGTARSILTAERTALNFLQTLSATATQTYHYVQRLKGTGTQLLDTRKTLPGLRLAQKYAVACAGGKNHRLGLYDAFLIKENHIKACGSITAAINKARLMNPDLFLEVEVESIPELEEALLLKPSRILLDNFSHDMLAEAVTIIAPYGCDLEASGGLDLDSIAAVAKTGVHYISVGSLTKSIKAIDLSLLIRERA
jgi:nicotinate-nucleotide pyrophosphorylase (carboxylating)